MPCTWKKSCFSLTLFFSLEAILNHVLYFLEITQKNHSFSKFKSLIILNGYSSFVMLLNLMRLLLKQNQFKAVLF